MEQDKIKEEYELEKRNLNIKWIVITICVAIFVAVIASEFTLIYYGQSKLTKSEAAQNATQNIQAISETLKNFRTVIDEIYIGDIDEQKIMDETIRGYIKGLDDEYSEYMTAEEWDEYQAAALGNYVGIGIYMSVDKNGNVVVVEPIKDTPAEAAGLKSGDIIIKLNNKKTDNVAYLRYELYKNKINDTIDLTIIRDGEEKTISVKLSIKSQKG